MRISMILSGILSLCSCLTISSRNLSTLITEIQPTYDIVTKIQKDSVKLVHEHPVQLEIYHIDINNMFLTNNFTDINIDLNANFAFNDFYFFIVFYTCFIGLIIYLFRIQITYQKYTCLEQSVHIPFIHEQTDKNTVLFLSLYTTLWIGSLIFCFLSFNDYGNLLKYLGYWICINMSSVLLPITRNSLWIIYFNLHHQKLKLIHRYIAVLTLISVIIKVVLILCYKPFSYLFIYRNTMTNGSPLWGTISSLSVILLFVFASQCIRDKCFEIFYFNHRFLAILMIVSASLHYTSSLFYLLPAVIFYVIDLILRITNVRHVIYVKIKKFGIKEENTLCSIIYLTLKKQIKIPAGSYFFLCFKDISSTQWHPLSLISQTSTTLVFCAKDQGEGTWTHQLLLNDINQTRLSQQLFNTKSIVLQGPYTHKTLKFKSEKYKYIFAIAGGIGITPVISVLQYLNEQYELRKIRSIKKIIFIWIVSHSSLVIPFTQIISNLSDNLFQIEIYSTNRNKTEDIRVIEETIPFKIILERPQLKNLIHGNLIDYDMLPIETGVICCGPNSISDNVTTICSDLNIDLANDNF